MLKQVEIDASKNSTSKNKSKYRIDNTKSKIIEAENRNVNEKIQSEKLDEEYRAKFSELKLGF